MSNVQHLPPRVSRHRRGGREARNQLIHLRDLDSAAIVPKDPKRKRGSSCTADWTGCRWSVGGGLSRPEPGRLARRRRSRERSMLGSEIETPIVERRRVCDSHLRPRSRSLTNKDKLPRV
jgi:hypothetical protein